jgi:hypothetical protein
MLTTWGFKELCLGFRSFFYNRDLLELVIASIKTIAVELIPTKHFIVLLLIALFIFVEFED